MTSIEQIAQEYLTIVDSIHGAYLDAITGFLTLVDEYDKVRQKMLARRPNIPSDAFDGATMVYGTDLPHQPQSRVVHACTQGEYRQRNAEGGQNHKVMGQGSLVQMYGFWEDCYRDKIAKLSGRMKDDLKIDIFGDMRLLRISIVHHRGIATKDVKRCKLLKWFKEGDEIFLMPEHFETIVERLRGDLLVYIETLT